MMTVAQEFAGWELTSEEALTGFDAENPCYGCLVGWGQLYVDSAGNQKVVTCHDTCPQLKEWLARQ